MGQVVAQTLVAVGVIVAVGSAEVLDGLVRMGCVLEELGGTYRAAAAARRKRVNFMVALGWFEERCFDSVKRNWEAKLIGLVQQ